MHGRWIPWVTPVVCAALAACPADDDGGSGDAGGTSSASTVTDGNDTSCPAGLDGCPCSADATCEPGLICVDDVCEIDTESDSGPSTASAGDTSDGGSGTADATGGSSGSDGGSSGSDTGGGACSSSAECPRGEVCTAPSSAPGMPAGPFTCGSTCAGLGIDAAVCTDDASCCGAFCNQGSCLAP